MNGMERDEARIVRLLAATRAEADPAVLTRVRARIASRVPEALFGPRWLGSPAALAMACVLLVVSAGAGFMVLDRDRAAAHDSGLVSALMGEDGSYGMPTAATATVAQAAVATDSEGVTR